MDFTVTSKENRIYIAGQIDTANSKFFEELLDQAVAPIQDKCIPLDGSGLEYICSSGLRTLIALQKRLAEQQRSIEVTNLQAHIREIFDMTGFSRIIPIK